MRRFLVGRGGFLPGPQKQAKQRPNTPEINAKDIHSTHLGIDVSQNLQPTPYDNFAKGTDGPAAPKSRLDILWPCFKANVSR